MFTKSNLLATLAGTTVMFFFGYLLWGMALAPFFESHSLNDVGRDVPDLFHIFVANLLATFGISTIYGKWSAGIHNVKQGFNLGALIGLFAGFGLSLLMFGTSKIMDFTGHLVESVVDIPFYGIIGAVIALVYKITEK